MSAYICLQLTCKISGVNLKLIATKGIKGGTGPFWGREDHFGGFREKKS